MPHTPEGMADGELAGVEIHVCPPEPEQLAKPHPRSDGQGVERLQGIALDGVQEGLRLCRRQDVEIPSLGPGAPDVIGRVAGQQAPADGLLQGPMEDGVEELDGARREAGREARAVRLREPLGGEPGQGQPADVGDSVQAHQLFVAAEGRGPEGRPGRPFQPGREILGDRLALGRQGQALLQSVQARP